MHLNLVGLTPNTLCGVVGYHVGLVRAPQMLLQLGHANIIPVIVHYNLKASGSIPLGEITPLVKNQAPFFFFGPFTFTYVQYDLITSVLGFLLD